VTPRAAITLIFAANGIVWGSFLARMPAIKAHLDFSTGQLGSHLWMMTTGALVIFQLMGRLIARFGSRRVSIVTGSLFPWMLPIVGWAPSSLPFAIALYAVGTLNGAMDVAMNGQAVEIEKSLAKRILSSVHGGWSVGSLTGATLAAGMEKLSIGLLPHFFAIAILMSLMVLLAGRALYESDGEIGEHAGGLALPDRRMLMLVVALAGGALAEGAFSEWSSIFLNKVVGLTTAVSAVGFAVFAASMAVGRLLGDRITDRVGERSHLAGGFAMACVGTALFAWSTEPIPSFLALPIAALGISGAFPIAYRLAGRIDHHPRARVFAALATAGYGGFLLGPPLIGQTAELTSLSMAFFAVAVLIAVSAFAGSRVRT
jgi:MFS family permease